MPRLPKQQRQSMVQNATADVPHGLRILELYVENVKRVKVARIKPKGNVVIVAGKNGQGKSSILDAIDWALMGTSSMPTFPIRKGQRTATIKANLGDFVVHRHFTIVDPEKSEKGNTYLTKLIITGKRGEQYPSPQVLLNELLGKVTFDPLSFLRLKDDAQVETLRSLVTFDIDIDALDAAQKLDYDERRIAGRGIDQAKAQLAAMAKPAAGLPLLTINTTAIAIQMSQATAHNAAIEASKLQRDRYLHSAQEEINKAQQLREDAVRLLAEAQRLDGVPTPITWKQPADDAGGLAGHWLQKAKILEIGQPVDTAELAEELRQANETNADIERARRYRETENNLKQSEELWKEIDERMKKRDADRDAAIARAKMPIDGLGVGFEQVMYNGLPLSQASYAEQIRVSMALGMAMNPKLRVLRIADGSLLDEDSLQLIGKAAEEHDFQVWIERVETTGQVSVVMEEGEASGDDVVPAPEEKKA